MSSRNEIRSGGFPGAWRGGPVRRARPDVQANGIPAVERDCEAPLRRPGEHRFPSTTSGGFTLIEMLVIIAIIAVLAAVVAPEVFRNVSDARSTAARSQIEVFALALDQYRLDNSAYPSSEQGLAALRTAPTTGDVPRNWRGPYLRRVLPDDPWGRPYVYAAPGRVNPQSYDLYSLGRDGKEGGEGEDADITSWGGKLGE